MSLEHGVEVFAGFMVLLSGFCPAAIVMRELGLKPERELAAAGRR